MELSSVFFPPRLISKALLPLQDGDPVPHAVCVRGQADEISCRVIIFLYR